MTILLSACDTTVDYFEQFNTAPELTVKGEIDSDFSAYPQDSMRLSNEAYILDWKVTDDKNIDLTIVADELFEAAIKDNRIEIIASGTGTGEITIKATDMYGLTNELTFTLTCYDIMPPIANLKVNNIPDTSDYEFDASASIDQDAPWGGKIVQYIFSINNKIFITQNTPLLRYSFHNLPKADYEISLTVTDNDDLEHTVTETITVE